MQLTNPLYKNIGVHIITSIFTVDKGVVKVLLVKRTNEPFKGMWSLVEVNLSNFTASDNLIVLAKKTNGYYIDHTNGNLIAYSPHTTTDYIKLSPDTIYEYGNYFDDSFFAFYDKDKNFIASNKSIIRQFTFTLPENAKYIRLSYLTANAADVFLIRKTITSIKSWGINILPNYSFELNKYINQNNGGLSDAANFGAYDFIEVTPGSYYSHNPNNYAQYAFYDKSLNYIPDNQSADGKKVFKCPANAKFVRITVNTWETNNYLKLLNPKFGDKIIEIGKQITDFDTIQNAINYANSTNQSHTIKISNGVYLESLEVKGTVSHSFIGASKTETIVSDVNDTTQKWETLQAATGYFESIYFKRNGGGYAVHVDYAGVGVAEFFNCRIESTYGSAVGYGQQQDQVVKFRNCQIIQRSAPASTGILYMHDAVDKNITGGSIQFWNCEVDGFDRVVRIDDANQIYGDGQGALGRFKPLFVGNNFRSKNHGKELDLRNGGHPTANGAIIGNIVIDDRSYGNNVPELNK
jgi:hypothetical protein